MTTLEISLWVVVATLAVLLGGFYRLHRHTVTRLLDALATKSERAKKEKPPEVLPPPTPAVELTADPLKAAKETRVEVLPPTPDYLRGVSDGRQHAYTEAVRLVRLSDSLQEAVKKIQEKLGIR